MSCFWDAIRQSLTVAELSSLNLTKNSQPLQMIKAFQTVNKPCLSVMWNNSRLSRNNLRENFRWISEYEESGTSGHLTSTCDPFLCLLVELFGVRILHKYLNNINVYAHTSNKHSRDIHYVSNKGHFSLK